jgi:ATP-binding cassette, subfamily C, bacterial
MNAMKKYSFFAQREPADCGVACLMMVLAFYGKMMSFTRCREAVGTGQNGTTLLGLLRGAKSLGFNARAVKVLSEILDHPQDLPLPVVIHWKGGHWVVWFGFGKGRFIIGDPAVGIRHLSREEMEAGWVDWTMLMLEPDWSRFAEQDDDMQIAGFRRFLGRVLHYRDTLVYAIICAFIMGLLSLGSPLLLQMLTDDVLVRGDTKLLNAFVIVIIFIYLLSSGLQLVQSNLIANFSQRIELSLVLEFCRNLFRLPLSYFESRRSGEVVSRLQDLQEINQLISQVVIGLPSQFFVGLVSLGVMLFYSWKLTLVALLAACLSTVSTLLFLPSLQQKIRKLLVTEAENQGTLVEIFKNAITFKALTAVPELWAESQQRFTGLAKVKLRTIQISFVNQVFSSLVANTGSIAILWFGSHLIISGDLKSIGVLLAFHSMNDNVSKLVGALIGFVDEYERVKVAVGRIMEVIDTQSEMNEVQNKPWVELSGKSDIMLQQITFRHNQTVHTDFLQDFTLCLPGGKIIALVGHSGCGKSSLVKLLAGLHPVKSGNIQIGAYNFADLDLDCWRRQFVLVPQEVQFWQRSIIDNFRLGAADITFDEIVDACRIAGADQFINILPETYQTILGEFGCNLSGGQRQRLAIARGIVQNPPILILDEATSGLDPRSEFQLLNRLLESRKGKTTILISHRPRVIQRADWVVVLEGGKLSRQGKPKDLLEEPGDHQDFLAA